MCVFTPQAVYIPSHAGSPGLACRFARFALQKRSLVIVLICAERQASIKSRYVLHEIDCTCSIGVLVIRYTRQSMWRGSLYFRYRSHRTWNTAWLISSPDRGIDRCDGGRPNPSSGSGHPRGPRTGQELSPLLLSLATTHIGLSSERITVVC
jgi:hypothetical protein